MTESPDIVVKVGGSLYNLPDLGPRLRAWLDGLGTSRVVIVPGGGGAAEVVRTLDQVHGLGEERAHWLALASLSLTGRFLAALVPRMVFVTQLSDAVGAWVVGCGVVLDPHAFALADEGRPGCLPHAWSATSDSVAARVAVASGTGRLALLKSTSLPPGVGWPEAARLGLIDDQFTRVVAASSTLRIDWVHFRDPRGGWSGPRGDAS